MLSPSHLDPQSPSDVGSFPPIFTFAIADQDRKFTLFPLLPPELRQQIWISAVMEPGMSFVQLESRGTAWRWLMMTHTPPQPPSSSTAGGADEADEIAAEVRREVTPRVIRRSHLMPLSSNKRADISSHRDLQRRLKILSLTCREARTVVRSLIARPGTLRLRDSSVLSLANSSDIIFLEYAPPELYESGGALAIDPGCPELDLIRRVAVRFCHQWQSRSTSPVCVFCGQVHNSTARRPVFPRHLYHILARHLPNLEEFFFLDYLIVRKGKDGKAADDSDSDSLSDGECSSTTTQQEGQESPAIRCGNRVFYEANPDDWYIKPQVLQLKSWLQDCFVRYASTSRFSRHRKPGQVRFGILACEHAITPPISLEWSQMSPASRKRRLEDQARRREAPSRRRIPHRQRSSEANEESRTNTVYSQLPFVFGNLARNFFEFTFRFPRA